MKPHPSLKSHDAEQNSPEAVLKVPLSKSALSEAVLKVPPSQLKADLMLLHLPKLESSRVPATEQPDPLPSPAPISRPLHQVLQGDLHLLMFPSSALS